MGLGAQEVISYLCIFANGLSKMPQIKRVHETQSVAGLSVTSILLELYCHGMLSGFHMAEGYPYAQFLEYPLLVLQNFLLLFLLGLATSSPLLPTCAITFFSTAIASMAAGAVPKSLMLIAMSVNIPLGLSSKGAQIQAIRSEGTSDNVAATAWVTNAVTGMMRLFTHLNSKVVGELNLTCSPLTQVPPEPLVLINSCVMIAANLAVCATISIFRGRKPKVA